MQDDVILSEADVSAAKSKNLLILIGFAVKLVPGYLESLCSLGMTTAFFIIVLNEADNFMPDKTCFY